MVRRSEYCCNCTVPACDTNDAPLHRTIIVDVGKSFQASAIEWFPKYGLRKIDAVLITHAHADGARSCQRFTEFFQF